MLPGHKYKSNQIYKDKKPHIIYIASTGSSGSTLLELLLGSFENIWAMGEIYVLPWEIIETKRPCGCGRAVIDCEYWSHIIKKHEKILKTNNYICLFRDNYSGGQFFRSQELIDIIFRKSPSRLQTLSTFCAHNSKLFSTIAEEANNFNRKEIKYLVDSSKDFYRLFWLSACESIDIKVIHIVKNPQSFVYSRIKVDKITLKNIKSTFRMSLRYIIENLFIEIVCKKLPKENCILIRYEDLASSPELVLNNISQWLELPFQHSIVSSFRSKVNHGIAGNIMRSRTEGIFLDERWKYNMSMLNRIIVQTITFFYYIKYKYTA